MPSQRTLEWEMYESKHFWVWYTQLQQRTCEQKMTANKYKPNNLIQIHAVQLSQFTITWGWYSPLLELSGGDPFRWGMSTPIQHCLFQVPFTHSHAGRSLACELLDWSGLRKNGGPAPSAIMGEEKTEEPTRLCLFREKAEELLPRPTELNVSVMES